MKSFTRSGQTYTFVCYQPHTTRDGREVDLAVWTSPCVVCGALFEVTTHENPDVTPYLNRRCTKHKRPGQAVRIKTVFD